MNEIVNKVTLKLEGKLSDQDLRLVRDTLQMVLTDYTVEPVCTEVVPYEYRLPDCYKYFLAAKTMDGRMSAKSRQQYQLCLEPMLRRMQLPVEQITANHLRAYLLEISTKPDGKQLAPGHAEPEKEHHQIFLLLAGRRGIYQQGPVP